MSETVFDELKRYVGFGEADEAVLRSLHPLLVADFERISVVFYDRILSHEGARTALVGGESQVGRLKVTLVQWMDKLLSGPWDEAYYQVRCRIGRVHVRIALPQHYMFGAMNVIREQMNALLANKLGNDIAAHERACSALGKILDLELAIMLHTYREDLLSQQARTERLATFGQLVGSIGHELRNPLGVIETSLYILKGRIGEDERAQKHVGRIGEQLQLANGIISKLLDMIRDRPLLKERTSIIPLLEEVNASVVRPPEVHFRIDAPMAPPEVEGDPVQLRQVFVNLLENAVAASSPKGEVVITAFEHAGQLRISVEDTGPGVDPSIRARLFEPLVTTKDKGIGLGLALVKRIVERHGGSITYAQSVGGGASFIVHLPLAGDTA
ncbi:MAG: protoglobin domain-containing protein [Myxococcaceae bacterium]